MDKSSTLKVISEEAANLRYRAEKRMKDSGRTLDPPGDNDQRLIHELQVQQVELEMQNEELQSAMLELQEARDRYSDLYDFAPTGYFTLGEKSRILEANTTFADLLGEEKNSMLGKTLTRFITREDQDLFYLHCRNCLEKEGRHSCEIKMKKADNTQFYVLLESLARKDHDGSREIRTAITNITERKRMEEELQGYRDHLEAERAYLQEEIKLEYNHENIIGQSDGLKYALYKIEQIADSDTTVLVLGETGTGKELVARAIHSLSSRKNRALVKVNCAALPPNLIENELFGHEKGSFTGSHSRHLGRFEVANGTTLFLDEIGELPLELQPKLLRVIQDGEFERLGSSRTIKVDTRIVAATNRNLEEEVRKGRFREDLWYRLNIFPITMPPLRDRLDDIPLLVKFYVQKISRRLGKKIEVIPLNVMEALQNYHWPGNVRELENVLERGVITSLGTKLRLIDELKKPQRSLSPGKKTLEAVERDHILQTLEQTRWKVGGENSASEILGLNRSTLRARMRKLNIRKP